MNYARTGCERISEIHEKTHAERGRKRSNLKAFDRVVEQLNSWKKKFH